MINLFISKYIIKTNICTHLVWYTNQHRNVTLLNAYDENNNRIHTWFDFRKSSSSLDGLWRWVSKNSWTVSVFHLVMDKVSLTWPLLSIIFTIGSSPRTYLICRLGNLAGRSLLTKAWIWGYAPNLQVHTSRIAFAYFLVLGATTSFWQHSLQWSLWMR